MIETTLSGSSLFNYIHKARDKGYRIIMYYILMDRDISKERIAYRVSQGGHNIPVVIIERRYNKSFNNLYVNYNLFDEIYFYDNVNQYHKLIGYYNNELEIIDSTSKWSSILKEKIKKVL